MRIVLLLLIPLMVFGQGSPQQPWAKVAASGTPMPWEVSRTYGAAHPDSALHLLSQSLRIAQQRHDSLTMARALCQLAWVYQYYLKDEGKFVQYARRALAVAKPRSDYNHLTEAYRLLGMASMHHHGEDPEIWFSQAVRSVAKTNDWLVQIRLYGTLTQHYESQKKYPQAERYCLLAMAVNRQHDLQEWFIGVTSYCELLKAQNKHKRAVSFARRMDWAKTRLPGKPGEFVYDNELARLALFQENYAEAERRLLAGLAIQQAQSKPDSIHLYFYYKNLVNVYKQQQAYQKAFETGNTLADFRLWLQRVRQTRDSKLQMTELKAATDLAKKQTEINLLAAQQRQQQLLLLGVAIIALLLIGFAVILQRAKRRIEQQNNALSRLNATKDKLFAMLSHDLRAPVANLTSYLTLHNWGVLSMEEFDHSARSLTKRLNQVQILLDNLLNWAVTQMGGFRAKPVLTTLRPIVEGQFALLQPFADSKGIQLVADLPTHTPILADPDHLAIIVRNLLQNAIKFTVGVAGSPNAIVTLIYRDQRTECQIIVQDTGIGIQPEILSHLFDVGNQSTRPGTANEPSTGLGLIVVKELIEANGGQIEVESEPGQGTLFTLTFATGMLPSRGQLIASLGASESFS